MTESKNLKKLLKSVDYSHFAGPDPEGIHIDAICSDSRNVAANDLFVALVGEIHDGHHFAHSVMQKGCAALLIERNKVAKCSFDTQQICIITVDDTREAFGKVVSAYYNHPADKLNIVGITGTNGKTTITYLLEEALGQLGERVGVIGTVNYRFTDKHSRKHVDEAPLTTPDPLVLQKLLRKMVNAGVSTVLMEVSSHALDQKRLGDIRFNIAAFTNLSHDHLDYHQSMEQYFNAKSILFTEHLKPDGKAVVTHSSCDNEELDDWATTLVQVLNENDISYVQCGDDKNSSIVPTHIDIGLDGATISLDTKDGKFSFTSPLVGRFNVYNIITSLAIIDALGLNIYDSIPTFERATGAPGRLERISLTQDQPPKTVAFVDYAHTPDALLNVLTTLKTLPHKRLLCVFGCGGDRDIDKRPEMGRIAAQLADIVIVTEDNPRSESSAAIIEQIMKGVCDTGMEEKSFDWFLEGSDGSGCVIIPKRREAIYSAIQCATPGDIVIIAGKGHENYQLTNSGKRFFDDGLEVREALLSWDVESIAAALYVSPTKTYRNRYLTEVCTDTRNLDKGQIFVALRGERFDGHNFIGKAVRAGAGTLVVSDPSAINEAGILPVFKVTDTLKALGDLAFYRRKKIKALTAPWVVGITGSCGKTTVKEMVYAIFKKQWPNKADVSADRVLKTRGNFNNLIGLPLSLLPLRLKHKAVILEMGMNQFGEISRLTEIADPDISCITNVHGAHIEGLGSIEGVAKAKEELFAATHPTNTLIINLDDPFVAEAAAKYNHRKIKYTADHSNSTEADIWATAIKIQQDGNINFHLHLGDESYQIRLKVPGIHNVENCLAAAAIAHGARVKAEMIVKGLEAFTSADKRLQVVSAEAGYSIINDTYNANPASMSAGLATLAAMNGQKKIAILGDMLELGSESDTAHDELGRRAAKSGLAFLLLVGSFAEQTARGAVSAGMERDSILIFEDKEDIVSWMKNLEDRGRIEDDSWVLVKASRGMKLETVVEKLSKQS